LAKRGIYISLEKLRLGMARADWRKIQPPNFSFKHDRRQSTKLSYRPVGTGQDTNSHQRLTHRSIARDKGKVPEVTSDLSHAHKKAGARKLRLSSWLCARKKLCLNDATYAAYDAVLPARVAAGYALRRGRTVKSRT